MKTRLKIIPVLLASSLLLTGCPTSEASKDMNSIDRVGSMSYADSAPMVMQSNSNPATEDRKLVRKVDLSLQLNSSDELPELLVKITNTATSVGGYVSNQSMTTGWDVSGYITANVPKDKTDVFLDAIKVDGSVKVTDYNDSLEDITTRYVDVESRLNSANQAKERYMDMLEQAETVSEILEIQLRLDEIISEEESYKAQMIAMDKQVDFSKIDIDISCLVNEEKTPFLQRVKESLSELGEDAGEAILHGLNWFVLAMIWLLFASPVIVVFTLVLRFAMRFDKKSGTNILRRFRKSNSNKGEDS